MFYIRFRHHITQKTSNAIPNGYPKNRHNDWVHISSIQGFPITLQLMVNLSMLRTF